MADFQPFDLGRVLGTAEQIKGMRRQSITDDLQQRYLGQQIKSGEQRMQKQEAQFSQEQQLNNTRLLNAAAAEVAANPAALQRWLPQLQEAGIGFDGDLTQMPPEQLQASAQQLFDSTSKALTAYSQSNTSAGLVQSTFQGGNGNAWVMTRDGRAVDTGVPMQRFAPQVREFGGGTAVFDPNVRGLTGQITTVDQEAQGRAAIAGAEAAAKTTATAEAEKAVTAPQRAEKARALIAGIDGTIAEIDNAIAGINWSTVGLIGAVARAVPGTPAYNLKQTILTIKANIGFDRLQQMRDSSPTGGALGQVAVQELDALQASIASLDQAQDGPQLQRNLQKVREHYENWKRAVMQSAVSDSRVQSLLDKYAPQ